MEDTFTFDYENCWNWRRDRLKHPLNSDVFERFDGNSLTLLVDITILKVIDDNKIDITNTFKFT